MHDFEETTPVAQPASTLKFGIVLGLCCNTPFCLLFAAAAPGGIGVKLLVFICGMLILAAFMIPYAMLIHRWTRPYQVQRIAVMKYINSDPESLLRVERGLRTYEAPLKDCVWRSQFMDSNSPRSKDGTPHHRARILIEMPPSAAKQKNPLLLGTGTPHVVKVGFSPEMEAAWLEAFSENKAVEIPKPKPETLDAPLPETELPPIAVGGYILLALPALFFATVLLTALVSLTMSLVGVPEKVCDAAVVISFTCSTIFGAFYVFILPMEARGSKAAANFGAISIPGRLFPLCGMISGLLFSYILTSPGWDMPPRKEMLLKIGVILLVSLPCLAAGTDLGRRISKLRRLERGESDKSSLDP